MVNAMTEAEAINKVLTIARAELGYHEKNNASSLDNKGGSGAKNYTKYSRDLDAIGYYNGQKQGAPWCDVFVDWLFEKAFGAIGQSMLYQPPKSLGAATRHSAAYFKKAGSWSSAPALASQIFFKDNGGIYHTGIVEEITPSLISTIEGNSADSVVRRTYARTSSAIAGYGIPNWKLVTSQASPVKDTISITLPELKKGDSGAVVRTMQILLIGYGYSCGKWCDDGEFGTSTLAALKQYQSESSLSPDGICGILTWNKLLKG